MVSLAAMVVESLLVLRHGRAAPGDDDAARTLLTEGQQQARVVGAWLRAARLLPDKVLCSTAVRAVDTARGVLKAAACAAELSLEPALYDGGAAAVQGLVEKAGGRLMVVGHNPVLELLLGRLMGCGDRAPLRLSPGSLALLEPEDRHYVARCLVSPELVS